MDFRQNFARAVSCSLLLVSLSSCTWLIPAEPSSSRYNTVLGERHAPKMNSTPPVSAEPSVENELPQPTPMVSQAVTPYPQSTNYPQTGAAQPPIPFAPASDTAMMPPAGDITVAPLPPVTAMPQAAAAAPVTTSMAQNRLAGLPPTEALTQRRAANDVVANTRQVPVENGAIQLASGEDLSTIPPRPMLTGPDSAQERLNATRNNLEQDRWSAGYARAQLATDAAKEPSLAPPMTTVPTTTVPQPTVSAPMMMSPSQPMMAPMPPLPPVTQPLAPPAGGAMPMQLHPPGSPGAAMTPVTTPMVPQQTAQLYTPMPVYSPPDAPMYGAVGGFDPMAVNAGSPAVAPVVTSSTIPGSFISPSRYVTKRD